jgi:tRNA U34 5-carboxymethylaminomethyl modifying enzyme MnmG/GidA
MQDRTYQVIVIGGGHAGVEGAIDATKSADATDRAAAQTSRRRGGSR